MIFSLNVSTCRRHVTTFDISGVNLPLPADMTRPTFAAKLLVTKTLNYPVAVGHFLVTVPDGGTEEEFLEERFRRAS